MFCTTCGREPLNTDGRCPIDGTVLVRRPTNVVSTTGQLALGTDSTDELVAGTPIGEYVIERRIGEGGMGVVYAARHPLIGKRAAIKVLRATYSADREAVARFILEAQAVNRIGHVNIVDVFSFGTLEDGRCYFVMEMLRGETLHARIDRAPMSASEVVPIIVALTRALEAAHAAGVIHRDLKPENVFLVTEDDMVRVKLLDFGIAKLLASTGANTSRTATGIVVGTPLFMSPEQARGLKVDARTDLYSLGVLAYQMVCRVTPFESKVSSVEILNAHISKPPRPPSDWVPDVPTVLEAVILELLAKQPNSRPSLRDVRHRLTRQATDPIEATPASAIRGSSTPTLATAHISRLSAGLSATETSDDLDRPRSLTVKWLALGTLATCVLAAVLIARRDVASPADPSIRIPPPSPPLSAAAPTPPLVEPPMPVPRPPPSMPAVGTLELTAYPSTATLTIDGQALTILRGEPTRIELAPGSHILEGSAPGYRPFMQQIEIEQSRTTSTTIRLRPQARPRPPAPVVTDTDAVVNPFADPHRTHKTVPPSPSVPF